MKKLFISTIVMIPLFILGLVVAPRTFAACDWGWCGGCVSTCHVSGSRCSSLLSNNCGQSTSTTTQTAAAPPPQTSPTSTTSTGSTTGIDSTASSGCCGSTSQCQQWFGSGSTCSNSNGACKSGLQCKGGGGQGGTCTETCGTSDCGRQICGGQITCNGGCRGTCGNGICESNNDETATKCPADCKVVTTTTVAAETQPGYAVACNISGVNGYYCTCAYGYTCQGLTSRVGSIPGPGGVDINCYAPLSGQTTKDQFAITCLKIAGTATTISGGAGTPCDSVLSRGACGADGCSSGQQRLCVRNALGQAVLGDCTVTDACSVQRQTVSPGLQCSGLKQLSFGEPNNGAFVGCSGAQNCFCQGSGSSLTGSVTCLPDRNNDSCGAPGLGATTTVTASTQVTTNTQTTTTTTQTVTATPAPVCLSITTDIASPRLGQSPRFTCTTVSTATRYEFQYKVGTQSGLLAPLTADSNITQPFAVNTAGNYSFQCRPCNANGCAPWTENW